MLYLYLYVLNPTTENEKKITYTFVPESYTPGVIIEVIIMEEQGLKHKQRIIKTWMGIGYSMFSGIEQGIEIKEKEGYDKN